MNQNKNKNDYDKWSKWKMKVVSAGVKLLSQVFGLRHDVSIKKWLTVTYKSQWIAKHSLKFSRFRDI